MTWLRVFSAPRSSDVGCAPVGSRTGRRAAIAHRDGGPRRTCGAECRPPRREDKPCSNSAASLRPRNFIVKAGRWRGVEALAQDVRFALRGFQRAPGFTAGSDSIAWARHRRQCRDLQHGEHAALAAAPGAGFGSIGNSPPPNKREALRCRCSPTPIIATSASRPPALFPTCWRITPDSTGLSAEGRADRIMTHYVTGNYFTLLGLKPALGRVILPSEGKVEGADPVLVLSYSYWKQRFASDPNVIGKRVLMNGHPVTVVGVAPRPIPWRAGASGHSMLCAAGHGVELGGISQHLGNRSIRNLYILGRLAPGISLNQAQTQLKIVSQRPRGRTSE